MLTLLQTSFPLSPGFSSGRQGILEELMYIRGIGQNGRRINVLIDGRPTKMANFGCTVTHSLPLNNVERIEVVRGPFSIAYGSDALGGVVNIITKRMEEGFGNDVAVSYDSNDTRKSRLRHGGNFSKHNRVKACTCTGVIEREIS